MNHNQDLHLIKQSVRSKYAWPGGHEMHLVMLDGGILCMNCARKEWKLIYEHTKLMLKGECYDKQWATSGADTYWEGPDLQCDHCYGPVRSAYGDPWEEDNADNQYDEDDNYKEAQEEMNRRLKHGKA